MREAVHPRIELGIGEPALALDQRGRAEWSEAVAANRRPTVVAEAAATSGGGI